MLGIRIVVPRELQRLAKPRPTIKAAFKGKEPGRTYLSLDGLLNFSWEVAIGDIKVSKAEFLKLVKSAGRLVKFRDQYILLNPDAVKAIMDRLARPVTALTPMETLQAALTGESGGIAFSPDEALKRIIDDIGRIEDIAIPSSLNGNLRPYQERGYRWLYSNLTKGFGSCLADDMGLGKTIQVIALLLALKERKALTTPALVVCPTTLVGNWRKECARFAPTLSCVAYHGAERKMMGTGSDLVITTYGTLRRNLSKFSTFEWPVVIIDEAQNIKNPDTDQTKAVKSMKARAFIAMSGTPVENRLTELWSIFDFINKGYLGHVSGFQQKFALPIEKYRDREQIERLKAATGPFIMRRLKSDRSIVDDLPEKLVFEEYCYLTKEQSVLYRQVVNNTMKVIEESEGIERKGLIFKLITSLKQICNHPAHFSKKGNADKSLSGKAERLIELTEKILNVREKALIFTQYREMGDLLAQIIGSEHGEEALFFHGGLTRKKRDAMVDSFQGDGTHNIMIVSLKAGGTGLNLTSASNVVHYDLWWNPAVEEQATDRTYRIGQEKNVMVHRLITLGTFEEKIDEMIKAKRELADLTVSTGERWLTEMSDRELRSLFTLTKA
jgi:SNF2 family DNA or RNA helicase